MQRLSKDSVSYDPVTKEPEPPRDYSLDYDSTQRSRVSWLVALGFGVALEMFKD